jgi:hypothetical protein
LKPGARLKVAASCFSMYAFEALKAELEQVDELHFNFTSPTFMAEEVTDKIRKERKEFHIPKLNRERIRVVEASHVQDPALAQNVYMLCPRNTMARDALTRRVSCFRSRAG